MISQKAATAPARPSLKTRHSPLTFLSLAFTSQRPGPYTKQSARMRLSTTAAAVLPGYFTALLLGQIP